MGSSVYAARRSMICNSDISPDLFRVPPDRAGEAARVLAVANLDDALWRWVFPSDRRRARALASQFEVRVRYGQRCGAVLATSAQLPGVSVWLPGDRCRMSLATMLRLGAVSTVAASGARSSLRLLSLSRFYDRRRDQLMRAPYLYLAAIAVRPEHQGAGIGGRMLRHMLAWADRRGLPCFLEAHTEANVALYRRFGFEVLDRSIVHGTNLTDWAMVRGPE